MINRPRHGRHPCLFVCLTLLLISSVRADRIVIPDDVFYYQPAASVFGSEATWINPAALGRYRFESFQLMADYAAGDYAKSWGGVVNRDLMAIAYRHIDNRSGSNFDEWVYAAGFQLGTSLDLGFSYRYFKNGPGLFNKRHFWNIGMTGTSGGALRWAAVLSNLNRGRVKGVRSEMEQRYSLAYRPIGSRFTLAVDMLLSTGTRLRNADYVYHAEFIPKPGIYVNALIDSDRNFQIGARVNLLKYFVGQKTGFDRHGHNGRTTVFAGATSQRQPSVIREPGRRLAITLSGRPSENPPRPVFGRKRTPFVRLIAALYRAARDRSVGEVLVSLKGTSLGFGQAQELRNAISYVRAHHKPVTCFIQSPGNISYYLASAADRIVIPPVSQLALTGLRAELTFYAGTLDKLGVKIDLIRIGEYKSAAESYTRQASTPENREQINRLLDDLYDQMVTAIAEGRKLSKDSVMHIIDNGPFTSTEALAYGLVDTLAYADNLVKELMSDMPQVSYRQYVSDSLLADNWQPRPVLAVVVAEGEITSDDGDISPLGRSGGVTPLPMRQALWKAGHDPKVRGILLRVNSPGGSALASDDILHAAEEAAKLKPLIVSMGNVAASGGYYLAMAGKHLFADPATVTGSIGIYGGKADYSGLYDKIDLGKELYTRGKYAGMLSSSRPFTADERTKYQSQLRAFYDHFVELVAANRGLAADSVDQLARGQVWTGREAILNGLIDQAGGIQESLDYLARQSGLSAFRVELYPRKRPLFIWPGRSLFGHVASLLESPPVKAVTGPLLPGEDTFLLARMPYDLTIE